MDEYAADIIERKVFKIKTALVNNESRDNLKKMLDELQEFIPKLIKK